AHVAVMPALEPILLRGTRPHAARGTGLSQPHEATTRLRLVAAIDGYCVMRGGPAKVSAPQALRVVGVRSRVDQELHSSQRQRQRESIGMAVRSNRPIA